MPNSQKYFNNRVGYMTDWIEYLSGQWTLARQITDSRNSQQGDLIGIASFTTTENKTNWSETGRLTLGDYQGDAWRNYWIERGQSGFCQVRFTDGRVFFDLAETVADRAVTHDCPPDRYDGTLTILGPDRWRLHWSIKGPRKDLAINSCYTRQPHVARF
jgi:hypothetical protein